MTFNDDASHSGPPLCTRPYVWGFEMGRLGTGMGRGPVPVDKPRPGWGTVPSRSNIDCPVSAGNGRAPSRSGMGSRPDGSRMGLVAFRSHFDRPHAGRGLSYRPEWDGNKSGPVKFLRNLGVMPLGIIWLSNLFFVCHGVADTAGII
jgi:hypothetical protein